MILRRFELFRSQYFCNSGIFILALLWCLAIAVGMLYAFATSDMTASLMRATVVQPLSLLGLTAAVLLPLLILALAACHGTVFPFYLICCTKGLSFGYCLYGALLAFDSAGWLVSILLMFPNFIAQIFMFCFLLRFRPQNKTAIHMDLLLCVICMVLICCIYYFKILPFLNELVKLL